MKKSFRIIKFEFGWAFVFCNKVTGLGMSNQRYFKTREELVEMLDSLGIIPEEYD